MKGTTPKRLILIIVITLIILPVSLSFFFRATNGIDYGMGKYAQDRRDQQGLKLIAEAKRRLREDTYGGQTPEETLQLFISALKSGDVELASKYFELDKQNKQKSRLLLYQEKNLLDSLIFDFQNNLKEVEPLYENSKRFILLDNKNRETGIFNLKQNINGVWKLGGTF